MRAALTAREAASALGREPKMLPQRDRKPTTLSRERFQVSHSVSIFSGRKSPSLKYQYSFIRAKIRNIQLPATISFAATS